MKKLTKLDYTMVVMDFINKNFKHFLVLSIFCVISLLYFSRSPEFGSSLEWHMARLGGFVALNALIGWAIYALFKRAGVIGGKTQDAELVEA